MALILDTGVTIALLDNDDSHHDACVELALATREDLVIPGATLAEVDYFLRKRDLGVGWLAFAEDIATGAYRVVWPADTDIVRAALLEAEYRDLRLGFVDASVIATCETLGEQKVATLDHRHFSVVRPRHCEALALLP
ncbi:type II toxin-antitoxin system VapC family toxin [Gaiella sp.]|uniref:type II toxin-antitoxin system VapC family toxin n=1 Tax=Gaiella sp. TaxID=2663207 RepID=UPI003982F3F0